jgi:hypothetical protein
MGIRPLSLGHPEALPADQWTSARLLYDLRTSAHVTRPCRVPEAPCPSGSISSLLMPVIIDATVKLRCKPREEAQTSMQPTGDALSWSTKPHLGDCVRRNLLLQNELAGRCFCILRATLKSQQWLSATDGGPERAACAAYSIHCAVHPRITPCSASHPMPPTLCQLCQTVLLSHMHVCRNSFTGPCLSNLWFW